MAKKQPLRFAVLGVGYFAQTAVLPAFSTLAGEVELVAIISDDQAKRRRFGSGSGQQTWREDQLPEALASGTFDAIYIVTPNHRHLAQATAALRAGVHVLLEKPMTVTMAEARQLQRTAQRSQAQLMIAYRLHCDPFYVEAIRAVRTGVIGEPRIFSASFSMQVVGGNIRTRAETGGGSIPDLGIYCINAARTVFGREPIEVRALAVAGHDARSRQVDEMTSVVLRFPGDGLASFTTSFGAADTSWFQVVGTKGSLCLDAAFENEGDMELSIERQGRTTKRTARIGDQVAGEIAYFADCIRSGRTPEPGVEEGLRDLRVIDAIQRAAAGRSARMLPSLPPKDQPTDRTIRKRKPEVIHTKAKKRLLHAAAPHA